MTRPVAYTTAQWLGLIVGPALFVACLLATPPDGMSLAALQVAGLTAWMAVWWMTEPLPIPATSLLPLIILPVTQAMTADAVASAYTSPVIYVFLSGFLLALAVERWHLHRRIALWTLTKVGCSPDRIVLGMILATGFISMWVNNTATTLMMIPTALAVIDQAGRLSPPPMDAHDSHKDFASALLLGIAYASSLGGLATLVGTAPNLIFAGAARKLAHVEIGFAEWLVIGLPVAIVSLIGTWLFLTRVAFRVSREELPGGLNGIRRDLAELGPMSFAERSVLVTFVAVATAWFVQPFLIKPYWPQVTDMVIAVTGALALFALPSRSAEQPRLLNWETAGKLPWGILLLFGGGLTLADAFETTGLSLWLGQVMGGLQGLPLPVVLLALVTGIVFLNELTSNTALATMLMPVMAAMAAGFHVHPLLLMVPAALASSCGFMMPVGTPPNAIVYGTGFIPLPTMMRTGFWLNWGSILLVTLAGYWLVPLIWALP